jgi:hypothetical protein
MQVYISTSTWSLLQVSWICHVIYQIPFKYFDECKYRRGFICKIKKWRCGYLHTHNKLNSCCPYSLEHLSLYEFISTYQKIPSIKQFLFKEPNPQQASHPLKAQTFRCIVNVFGVQLLDISQEDLAFEKCLSYL